MRKKQRSRTAPVTLITGAAGFIGSNFANYVIPKNNRRFVIVDALTPIANRDNLTVLNRSNCTFIRADICDVPTMEKIFKKYRFTDVIHFAAETHVDVSIRSPKLFIETNIVGTYNLLALSRAYGISRFFHISTDEVYGALREKEPASTERDPHRPNSPYSASKASAEHIVRAFNETFGLHTVIARCSNNYGPYQDSSKFIPVCILNVLRGRKIPVYGSGKNIRDWLYVDDCAKALDRIWKKGRVGEAYNVGAGEQRRNIDVARMIVKHLGVSDDMIEFVPDRLGHDFRYALNTTKIRRGLGWRPTTSFEDGLKKTVWWYVERYAPKKR